jgi:D-serine deaminase-like pyridoxal phosphate-dependent protein
MGMKPWYQLRSPKSVITPALLVYPDRIAHNIDTMLKMTGGPQKLRPHVKTHKNAEIIKMQMDKGITKFKCATIAEAELLAQCAAPDVLLAMQPVGANMDRFMELSLRYPNTKFAALVDNEKTMALLGELAEKKQHTVSLYLDLNVGMNRTGIIPSARALALYRAIDDHPYLKAMGLHVYDGHLRNPDVDQRQKDCDSAFKAVELLADQILQEGLHKPIIVAGGSPTFPFHAKRKGIIASPGTTLLWDAGYRELFPEMDFLPAAVLMTRILSNPKTGVLCFDLGHKSIAPEMPFPRVVFLTLEHSQQIGQSEEHLVVQYDDLKLPEIGEEHYAIPKHICPTVAKYDHLMVVQDGNLVAEWKVAARNQKINL